MNSPSKSPRFNELQAHPPAPAGLGEDPRWQLVTRISRSEVFRRAPRLRSLLQHIAERGLLNQPEQLTEYQIGVQVFGRAADFDPAEDSIVRSSARLLRNKLQEYFATEGKDQTLRLEVPKGSYLPEFGEHTDVAEDAAAPENGMGARGRLIWGLALLCAALAILCVYLWQRSPSTPAMAPPNAEQTLFAALFPPRTELNVICSDSTLSAVNTLRKPMISLEDYVRFREQDPLPLRSTVEPGRPVQLFARNRLITSYWVTGFVQRVVEQSLSRGIKVILRHSRHMQARDFRSGYHILLGGPMANPWVTLFDPQLNFQFAMDPATGHYSIRNVRPQPGESQFYWTSAEESRNGRAYARLALVRNLEGHGRLLLLSGIQSEGTEGAADAVLSPQFPGMVKALLKGRTLDDVAVLDMLLEVTSVDGVVSKIVVAASRVTPGGQRPAASRN